MQRLPNGNTFVGWGSRRYFTEYDAAGKVVLDGRLAAGGDNYRAYRFEWTGRPDRPPALVAERDGDRVRAHVSWNGATGVAAWELWAGASAGGAAAGQGRPRAPASRPRSPRSRPARYVAVKALDATGVGAGRSSHSVDLKRTPGSAR